MSQYLRVNAAAFYLDFCIQEICILPTDQPLNTAIILL